MLCKNSCFLSKNLVFIGPFYRNDYYRNDGYETKMEGV